MSISNILIEKKLRNLQEATGKITPQSKDVLETDFTELEDDLGTYAATVIFDKEFVHIPEVNITDTVSKEGLFMQWQKENDTTIILTTTEPINCTVTLI